MIEHSAELKDLAAALVKAQATVKGAVKDSNNPFYKSKYADLASVLDACGEALTVNGLSVVQLPGYVATDNSFVATLTTMLLHTSGQWLQETGGAPIAKPDAQGVGSVVTYLRRYALQAVARVAPEDDDGNAASGGERSEGRASGAQLEGRKTAGPAPAGVDRNGEFRIPGGPDKWDGLGGSLITDRSVSVAALTKIRDWLIKKADARNQLLIDAMTVEMERRRIAAQESLSDRPKVLDETEEALPFERTTASSTRSGVSR